jgi:hypothetical protein
MHGTKGERFDDEYLAEKASLGCVASFAIALMSGAGTFAAANQR